MRVKKYFFLEKGNRVENIDIKLEVTEKYNNDLYISVIKNSTSTDDQPEI